MRCVHACPVKALGEEDYPEGLTDKKACATRSEALSTRYLSPCGLCIRICPVGADREAYAREDPEIYNDKDERYRLTSHGLGPCTVVQRAIRARGPA